jgi:hypothetical protein
MKASASRQRVVQIHALAPPKPPPGAPCNGCGVCCLSEPCPVGILVSRRRHGPCRALRWDEARRHYRCGLLKDGTASTADGRPRWGRLHPGEWLQALWRRWIAEGAGCDADLTAIAAASEGRPPRGEIAP